MLKDLFRRYAVIGMAMVFAVFLLGACTNSTQGPSSVESGSSGSSSAGAPEPTASSGSSPVTSSDTSSTASSAVSSASSGTAFRDSRVSDAPVETDIPDNSILLFDGSTASEVLKSNMESGRIPVVCKVLYDTMGERPTVDVFDPDQIVEIYNLLSQVTVEGQSDMSVTDSYHNVVFYLQNGLAARYSFEGEDLLCLRDGNDEQNYALSGYDALWTKVRQIQDDYLEKAQAKGVRQITVSDGDDLILWYPREAVPGDLVCVGTMGVTDAFMNVTANGVEVENWGDIYFTFVMPDADVELEAYISTPPGGGLA